MSTAESIRDMLPELWASMGMVEMGYGGCWVESDGRDMCLPPESGLLNNDGGYC